jgi:hypothetical protein
MTSLIQLGRASRETKTLPPLQIIHTDGLFCRAGSSASKLNQPCVQVQDPHEATCGNPGVFCKA